MKTTKNWEKAQQNFYVSTCLKTCLKPLYTSLIFGTLYLMLVLLFFFVAKILRYCLTSFIILAPATSFIIKAWLSPARFVPSIFFSHILPIITIFRRFILPHWVIQRLQRQLGSTTTSATQSCCPAVRLTGDYCDRDLPYPSRLAYKCGAAVVSRPIARFCDKQSMRNSTYFCCATVLPTTAEGRQPFGAWCRSG